MYPITQSKSKKRHRPIKSAWMLLLGLMFSASALSQGAYQPVTSFGANPGQLTAQLFSPAKLKPAQKQAQTLVVILHGCGQQGIAFAEQSGWLSLAQQRHFYLLVPQQAPSNNIKSCFNWFSAEDTDRHGGESLSLANMIKQVKADQPIDTVNIVGLSAGGAMASVLLANYPALFSHGAIIAGLPYRCADNLVDAIGCMKNGPKDSVSQLTQRMRSDLHQTVKWPSVSIWFGAKDNIVSPNNAHFMAKQWVQLNALPQQQPTQKTTQKHDDYQIDTWRDPQGKARVQLIQLDNLGHGMPVQPSDDSLAPFILHSPLAAATTLTDWWQL